MNKLSKQTPLDDFDVVATIERFKSEGYTYRMAGKLGGVNGSACVTRITRHGKQASYLFRAKLAAASNVVFGTSYNWPLAVNSLALYEELVSLKGSQNKAAKAVGIAPSSLCLMAFEDKYLKQGVHEKFINACLQVLPLDNFDKFFTYLDSDRKSEILAMLDTTKKDSRECKIKQIEYIHVPRLIPNQERLEPLIKPKIAYCKKQLVDRRVAAVNANPFLTFAEKRARLAEVYQQESVA